MIRKLGHLCLVTDNLPRLLDFYTRQLGFSIKFPFINSDGEIFGYYLECGDTTFIEIFDRVLRHKQWNCGLEQLQDAGRVNHFCFEVTGLHDLRAALESKGLTLSPIRTGMDRSLQTWTSDPDGNPIELMEFTSQSLQLQPRSPQP